MKKIFISQQFEVRSRVAKPKSTELHNSIIRPEDMLSYFIDENDICKTCGYDHSYYNRKFETDPCNCQTCTSETKTTKEPFRTLSHLVGCYYTE